MSGPADKTPFFTKRLLDGDFSLPGQFLATVKPTACDRPGSTAIHKPKRS